jgi:uncharacterized protein YndB with AHSA1/START domain
MAHIKGEITINRPVETVFDFVADERNEPKFNPDIHNVEKITDEPIGTGTMFQAASFNLNQISRMVIEITDYDRPRKLATSTNLPYMDTEGTLTFERKDNGTLLKWEWDITPHGIFTLMSPFIGNTGKRQEEKIWKNLKQYLENTKKLPEQS